MNRSVLIVTPYFAPQAHAAVFRAHKLAKYLPLFGWKPYVLTVDRHYLYNEDPSLLTDLPPEVEIIRAPYIEPSIRGLRMALGGRDRSFSALKARSENESPQPARHGLAQQLYRRFRESWLQAPDAHWTWKVPAIRAGRALIQTHKIPIIYSTCLPFTTHRIARSLRQPGCRWVADFRDPASYASRMNSPVDRVYLQQRRIERSALQEADAVTTTSSAYAMIFRDLHPGLPDRPIHFIPTGLDESLLDAETPSSPPSSPFLVFSGEFLPEYGGLFLEIFSHALKRPEVKSTGIKLLIVGQIALNRQRLSPSIDRLNLHDHVEFRDHLPQRELYRLLRASRAGILAPGREAHWWNNFAKMVDYLALRTPVLAIVPDPSEARSTLSRAGLGLFLDGDVPACADRLARFLLKADPDLQPVASECDRYLASHQVQSFADLFESLISPSPTHSKPAFASYRSERRGSLQAQGNGPALIEVS